MGEFIFVTVFTSLGLWAFLFWGYNKSNAATLTWRPHMTMTTVEPCDYTDGIIETTRHYYFGIGCWIERRLLTA